MSRASRRLRSAFFCMTASMLFLVLAVGCGGGDGGQEQEEQDQASEETTTQEATRATTATATATATTQETTAQEETNEQSANGVTEYVGTIQGVDSQEDSKPGDYFVALAIDRAGNAEAQLFSGSVEQSLPPPESASCDLP
jgi:ABC-type molybdate transport system substrate-binding protein